MLTSLSSNITPPQLDSLVGASISNLNISTCREKLWSLGRHKFVMVMDGPDNLKSGFSCARFNNSVQQVDNKSGDEAE